MGQYMSGSAVEQDPLQPNVPLPAFVVPAHLHFTPGQLSQLVHAGQQPGVPFQISETNAQRAVGERKKAGVVDIAATIRKGSIYFERIPQKTGSSKIAVGFSYDSAVPLQLSIYVTAKDRSDSAKLKIADSRLVLGPYNICGGNNLSWNSREEEAYIDILALQEKPRSENSAGYDIIIVTRNMFPKSEKRSRAMIFMATMCRMTTQGAIFAAEREAPQEENDTKNGKPKPITNKNFPLTCIMQKAQSKSGVFAIEEIYGLEAIIRKQAKNKQSPTGTTEIETPIGTPPATQNDDHDCSDTTGDCVICLSEPSSVALYPCRHWCVCMACAEALPSQQNTCPVCRQPFYLLLDFQTSAPRVAQ